MNRQKKKRENTRKSILEQAEKIILEEGLESLTIEKILDNADIARGTFYYNFQSKDEVINALVEENYSDFSVNVENAIKSSVKPLEILKMIILGVSDWTEKYPDIALAMLNSRFDPKSRSQVSKGSFRTLSQKVIIEAQKNNEIRGDISADELSRMLAMLVVQAQMTWFYAPDKINLSEKMENCLKVFLEGASK